MRWCLGDAVPQHVVEHVFADDVEVLSGELEFFGLEPFAAFGAFEGGIVVGAAGDEVRR